MAKLIKCPSCGHAVSKKARSCPNCGHRKKRFLDGCGSLIVIVILIAVVVWFLGPLLLV